MVTLHAWFSSAYTGGNTDYCACYMHAYTYTQCRTHTVMHILHMHVPYDHADDHLINIIVTVQSSNGIGASYFVNCNT